MADKAPNLYQKQIKVMERIQRLKKEKASGVPYRVMPHDKVVKEVRAAHIEQGIMTLTSVVDHGVEKHNDKSTRTWATVETTFVNADNPDERYTIISFGYGVDQQDKGPGKAVSYATKYALLKIYLIETGDDPDLIAGPEVDYQPPAQEPDQAQQLDEVKVNIGELLEALGIESAEAIRNYIKEATKGKYEYLANITDLDHAKRLQEIVRADLAEGA